MVDLCVVEADISVRPSDLMVLKYANGFHGVDQAVANAIEFSGHVPDGERRLIVGRGTEARHVLFKGVGNLSDFRYEKIRLFAREALRDARLLTKDALVITSPVHGPGYGLDEKEAFLSLIAGCVDAVEVGDHPRNLSRVELVEWSPQRASRYERWLEEFLPAHAASRVGKPSKAPEQRRVHENLRTFGAQSEQKSRLFVAMPFADEYSDIYDVSIRDAADHANIPAERLLEQAYTGDILTEIKSRIKQSVGLIAVLDGSNPNVFLEIGYAWALKKPTILLAKAGSSLPFDVSGQKCIMYKSISHLREELKINFSHLKARGVF